jgi:hypothetical protein
VSLFWGITDGLCGQEVFPDQADYLSALEIAFHSLYRNGGMAYFNTAAPKCGMMG